jgi:hypothetical protein
LIFRDLPWSTTGQVFFYGATPHNGNCGALRKFFARHALHQLEIRQDSCAAAPFPDEKLSRKSLLCHCAVLPSFSVIHGFGLPDGGPFPHYPFRPWQNHFRKDPSKNKQTSVR